MLRSASPYDRLHVFPNHLGKPTEFIIEHIPTKNSPRGVLFSHDGNTAYVANSLDDSITVIDVSKLEATDRIDLGQGYFIAGVLRRTRGDPLATRQQLQSPIASGFQRSKEVLGRIRL